MKTPNVNWDIRTQGRAWTGEEIEQRIELTPGKFEIVDGRLFWSDEDRLNLLAMRLENVRIEKALRLGKPELWKQAIVALK